MLHIFNDHLEAFRRDHEGFFDVDFIRRNIDGIGVPDFIFFIPKIFLKVLVVFCSHRHDDCLQILWILAFFFGGNLIVVILIDHNLDTGR